MAHQIKPSDATALLEEIFPLAEDDYRENTPAALPPRVIAYLFSSVTQAYREALLGCAIARIINHEIDIRFPATESHQDAFSGRSLADNVVTPFFRQHAIPASGSPYLSSLRGGAKGPEHDHAEPADGNFSRAGGMTDVLE